MAEVSFIIRAKNATKAALKSAGNGFKRLADSAKSAGSKISAALGKAKGFLIAFGVAAAALGATIKKSFEFETLTTQFEVLFKDLKQAKAHMEDLKQFSAETPFQLTGIAEASRMLHNFSSGALGGVESLKLVGDAAAAVNRPIQEVAFWVGRAFDAIKEGKPFGEAAARLQEMSIISGETRSKMEDLQKAGATNAEVWGVLTDKLKESEGGMEKLSTTGGGLFSTLKDNWSQALAAFGDEFQKVAKDGIAKLIEWIKKLKDDGSIKRWAENTRDFILGVVKNLKVLFGWIKTTIDGFKRFADAIEKITGGKKLRDELADIEEIQRRINAMRELAGDREEKQVDRVAVKRKSVQESLAEAQLRIDSKLAAKREAADKKRAAKQQKQMEALFKKREAIERKIEAKGEQIADAQNRKNEAAQAKNAVELKKKAGNMLARALETKDERKARKLQERDADRLSKRIERARAKEGKRGFKLSKRDRELLKADDLRKAAEAAKKVAEGNIKARAAARVAREKKQLKVLEDQLAQFKVGIKANITGIDGIIDAIESNLETQTKLSEDAVKGQDVLKQIAINTGYTANAIEDALSLT